MNMSMVAPFAQVAFSLLDTPFGAGPVQEVEAHIATALAS
jgi:hypothetical protein